MKFEVGEIFDIKNLSFDAITSCRCIINQPSINSQLKIFNAFYERLKPNGSLIIVEQSKEGIDRLNNIRKEFGLKPLKIRWCNLPIEEKSIFPKIEKLFKMKTIKRLGTFYYISRVIHPALVFPDEPKPNTKINELAVKSELVLNKKFEEENTFEKFGTQILVHFVKK